VDAKLLPWVGGEHLFALRVGELEALQLATDSGPGEVLSRLYTSMTLDAPHLGPWRIGDIIDSLRLGLIGGGTEALEARNLVMKTLDRHGPVALLGVAAEVLVHSIAPRPKDGEGEDAPGKPEGETATSESGTSPKS